jgi:hypothetical protein
MLIRDLGGGEIRHPFFLVFPHNAGNVRSGFVAPARSPTAGHLRKRCFPIMRACFEEHAMTAVMASETHRSD